MSEDIKVNFSGTGKVIFGLCVWGLFALLFKSISFDLLMAGIILGAVVMAEVIEHIFKALFIILKK